MILPQSTRRADNWAKSAKSSGQPRHTACVGFGNAAPPVAQASLLAAVPDVDISHLPSGECEISRSTPKRERHHDPVIRLIVGQIDLGPHRPVQKESPHRTGKGAMRRDENQVYRRPVVVPEFRLESVANLCD